MTDRRQIQDQLARLQSELAIVKEDIKNPERACFNYGLASDFCIVFKSNLEREASQIEAAIVSFQEKLHLHDLLAGTWVIRVPGQSESFVGQLTIASVDADGTFLGTVIWADTLETAAITGSYYTSEQQINFTRSLPEGFAQQYVGTVNAYAQLPTMQGEMMRLLLVDAADGMSLPSSWSAQKRSSED